MPLCSYLLPIIAIQFHMEKGGRKSASRETVLCYLPRQVSQTVYEGNSGSRAPLKVICNFSDLLLNQAEDRRGDWYSLLPRIPAKLLKEKFRLSEKCMLKRFLTQNCYHFLFSTVYIRNGFCQRCYKKYIIIYFRVPRTEFTDIKIFCRRDNRIKAIPANSW